MLTRSDPGRPPLSPDPPPPFPEASGSGGVTEAQAEGPGQARGALESVSASVKWGHGWSPRQRLSWHWEPLGATFRCAERAWGQHRSPHGRGEGSAVRAAVEASTPQSDMGETAPSSRLRPPGGPPQPGRSLKGPSRCLSLGEHPAASPTRTPTSDRQLWREGHLPGSGTRCILPPSVCAGVLGSEDGGFLPVVMETAASLLRVWVLRSGSAQGGERPPWVAAAVTLSAAQQRKGPGAAVLRAPLLCGWLTTATRALLSTGLL